MAEKAANTAVVVARSVVVDTLEYGKMKTKAISISLLLSLSLYTYLSLYKVYIYILYGHPGVRQDEDQGLAFCLKHVQLVTFMLYILQIYKST